MPPLNEIVRSRLLSSLLVLSILAVTYFLAGDAETVARVLATIILPTACIWYGDELGSLTGFSTGLARPQVTETTPGIVVVIGGWLLLLAIMAAVIITNQ